MAETSVGPSFLIDVHCHIHDESFAADRDAVLRRARRSGVTAVLGMGEDERDNERLLAVAERHRGDDGEARVLPALGLHPARAIEGQCVERVVQQIRANADRVVAIGEVGLDYWLAKERRPRLAQRESLALLVGLALELDLPLSVHSRSAGHQAIALLAELGARRVCLHAFDGAAKHATRALELPGCYFSIPPSVVRSPQKQKLVRRLPLERLLLESDAPVLGADPQQRNEPASLLLAAREVASLKGVSLEQVISTTSTNARELFGRDL